MPALVALGGVAGGCDPTGPDAIFEVFGRVTIDGQPAEGVPIVVFDAVTGFDWPYNTEEEDVIERLETDSDGRYRVRWGEDREDDNVWSVAGIFIERSDGVVFEPSVQDHPESGYDIWGPDDWAEPDTIPGDRVDVRMGDFDGTFFPRGTLPTFAEVNFTGTRVDGENASACADFDLRLFADSDTIPVVPGQTGQVEIHVVDRAAGFTGAVALMLVPGAGGDQPHEVLYQHAFEPNPVTYLNGDLEFSILTFTAHLNGLSVGETFDIDVAGASPHHEAVPVEDWCRLPVTFMVFGS